MKLTYVGKRNGRRAIRWSRVLAKTFFFALAAVALSFAGLIASLAFTDTPFAKSVFVQHFVVITAGLVFAAVLALVVIPLVRGLQKPAETLPELETPLRRSFFGRLGGWTAVRRCLFLLVGLVTLVVFFYAEENWRGQWVWERYRRASEARGQTLEPSAYIPPPVPDDQNFAMTPLLAPLLDFEPGTQKQRDTNALNRILEISPRFNKANAAVKSLVAPRSNSWVTIPTDLPAWHSAFLKAATADTNGNSQASSNASTNVTRQEAAEHILAALEEARPALDELRVASRRPFARYNLSYSTGNPAAILIPHLQAGRRICKILQLRASAELALGHDEAALDDITLALRMAESLQGEPVLISHLVCVSEIAIILQPLCEGLAAHQWTETQLQALQLRLQNFDMIANGRRALGAERVLFGNGVIDFLQRDPNKYRAFNWDSLPGEDTESFRMQAVLAALAPSGWFYLEKRRYNQLFDDWLTPLCDVENHRITPELSRRAYAETNEKLQNPPIILFLRHEMFSAMFLPALSKVAQRSAQAQTGTDFAVLACALERYRLAHQEYPERLDALTPQFIAQLPHDIITGQPLKYQRTDDGRFVLYSVGWNERDDGGAVGLKESGAVDWDRGDWVWRYPAK